MSRLTRFSIALAAAAALAACGSSGTSKTGVTNPPPVDTTPKTWTLSWSDEFDGAAGSAADPTKWGYDVGGGGWGNRELEYYTSGTENAALDGAGHLVITARKETTPSRSCWNGPCQYTSARLLTKGKFSQTLGRFEARIKIPRGQGIWPAFWMLGDDIDTKGWPTCGEIDVMENIGKEPTVVHGTIHGPPGYSIGSPKGAETAPFADDFHTYAVEWEAGVIRFYVDSALYRTTTPSDLNPSAGERWVFDHSFFMILNVAVGGDWPGSPDATSTFPQEMVVDWVRVYKR